MLQKFKEKIVAENLLDNFNRYNDVYLLSYLRARKFDLDKTYLMFSDFIKWRVANDVENIEVSFFVKKNNFSEL